MIAPGNNRMEQLLDDYEVGYVVFVRYMQHPAARDLLAVFQVTHHQSAPPPVAMVSRLPSL